MAMSNANLSRILQRPPLPAPIYGPRRRQPTTYRSMLPPKPWIFRHDPFLVLVMMEAPFLALLLLKAL